LVDCAEEMNVSFLSHVHVFHSSFFLSLSKDGVSTYSPKHHHGSKS
jgi:hypothetical protein